MHESSLFISKPAINRWRSPPPCQSMVNSGFSGQNASQRQFHTFPYLSLILGNNLAWVSPAAILRSIPCSYWRSRRLLHDLFLQDLTCFAANNRWIPDAVTRFTVHNFYLLLHLECSSKVLTRFLVFYLLLSDLIFGLSFFFWNHFYIIFFFLLISVLICKNLLFYWNFIHSCFHNLFLASHTLVS